ncbi:FAD-binding protein [Nocardioides sp. B-3]|uniref:FAD-binding protein n=1 Tax=Nocardioides sp. B-3 TaxID=2895565 RepID=UPI00215357F9|nr:FAD-binding protein [Nocardioides sp. B-3]UUZ58532.1 FAD-binding protein [Nocardioides sp. B-3]
MRAAVGWDSHREGVARLPESYAALPPGAPVRLAKPTTNLFRGRSPRGPGLDVSGLDGVISIDDVGGTADVRGMCTYEHLVEATLPHWLIPLVVPQLRTITLGGAVTGLGIEATSFRSGLPHESVLEMDVLTGAGEIVTTRPGDDLFDAFPELLRLAGLCDPTADRARAHFAVRRDPARALRRSRRAAGRDLDDRREPGVGRGARRWCRWRGLRAGRGLPDARPVDRRARPDQ